MIDEDVAVVKLWRRTRTVNNQVESVVEVREEDLDRLQARLEAAEAAIERAYADMREVNNAWRKAEAERDAAREERDLFYERLNEARADAERLAEAADDYVASRRVDAKELLIAALAEHEERDE